MPRTDLFRTRPSHRALAMLALWSLLFLLAFADAAHLRAHRTPSAERQEELARRLKLTDLCLFPEARYTRHLSQADRFSAFQDHPSAREHFPSGSLVRPPASLNCGNAHLDRETKVPH